jgi:outer membrane lipoprotein-sorting protein
MSDFTRRHLLAFSAAAMVFPGAALAQDPQAILRAAFDNWRANSSHAVAEMTIRGSHGTRTLTMESWTEGSNKALVRFVAPARDAGIATLQNGRRTYVFNPKLNQVIQLPASAMQQSWMGSDFSYNDLSKTEQIITDYTHRLLGSEQSGGHTVYVIEAIPKRGKPIVWGKQVLRVRDDNVLMGQQFYDQNGNLVREMVADRIGNLGGRPYPVQLTMRSLDKPGQWTRITTQSAEFGIRLPGYLFTRSNLQNPR